MADSIQIQMEFVLEAKIGQESAIIMIGIISSLGAGGFWKV